MPRAVLQIDADTSGLLAAFAAVRGAAKAAEADVKASMGNAVRASTAGYQRTGRVARDEAARTARAEEQGAQRSLAAFVRSEDQKRRALAMTAASRRRAETDATKFAQDEARKRGLTGEQEARVRQGALERFTRQYESAEKRQTTIAQREQAARSRQGRDIGYGLRRGLNVGRDAALNVAREAHVQIQDARQRRAASEHTLNAAFFQAGIGGNEATAMRSRLQREIATGGLRGLSMEDVSGALMGAQTQFSVLSGASPAERAQRLDEQVSRMRFARATFQDPAEVLRVSGMLSQQGIRGGDQMSVLQSLTGMAQAGSIELSTLTGQALGPLMQNLARVTNQNQTPEQRAAAVRRATAETMAVGEIGAAAGLTPRDSLNALAKLRTSAENPMVAERLNTRLRAAGRADLAGQLIQGDAQQGYTLRNSDPIALMSSLVTGMGGDTNAVTNLLSAGGSRGAMVLDSQQRRLISAMASQTSGGQTIAQRVSAMTATGSNFGMSDVGRGAAMVDAEQQTALRAAEATRDNALTDNTSAIVNLSNQFATWSTANPIQSSAMQSGGGLLGGILGGATFSRIGTALAGTGVGGLLTGATSIGGTIAAAKASGLALLGSAGGIGATLAGTVGAAGAGTVGAVVGAGAALGGGAGTLINRAVYDDATMRDTTGRTTREAGGQAAYTNVFSADMWRGFSTSVSQAVRDGLSNATVTATVAPVDAAHASAQAPAPSAAAR
jgi:hypothetical protein